MTDRKIYENGKIAIDDGFKDFEKKFIESLCQKTGLTKEELLTPRNQGENSITDEDVRKSISYKNQRGKNRGPSRLVEVLSILNDHDPRREK